MATDVKDGRVRVVVTALDQNDQFLNFLNMAGTATSPDPKKPAIEIPIKQEGPGRYVGEFSADEAGSYSVDHTSTVLLFGKDGKFTGTIAPEESDSPALDKLRRIAA